MPSRKNAVRAAHVSRRLGGHGGRLQPQAGLPHGRRSLVDHGIGRASAVVERQIETHQLELEAQHRGVEDAQRFFEELLPCLVTLANDYLPQ